MAVMTKPINRITVIKEKDTSTFIKNFNENKVSTEFLTSCKKAGTLFSRKK